MLNRHSTIYLEFLKVKNLYPKRTALYYEGKVISYQKLDALIRRFASYFDSIGLKKEDTITLVAPNTPESVACFFASSMKGLKIHLILPLATEETIIKEMKEKNSKLLVTLSLFLNQYQNILKLNFPILIISPTDSLNIIKKVGFALLNKEELKTFKEHKELPRKKNMKGKDSKEVSYSPTFGRVFLSSGGTSGEPKTIILSDEAILSLISQGLDILSLTEEEAIHKSMLAALPMFHGFGLVMGVLTVLYFGASAALLPKFHTKPVIDLLKKHRLNIVIGVPAMYEALLKNPHFDGKMLQDLDVLFVGGDFISPSLLERFNTRLKKNGSKALLLEGYGLTETVTVLSVNTIKNHKENSVGRPLKNVEVQIINEEHHLLPPKELGEIIVAGDTLMNGYYDGSDCFITLNGKKYVLTGDLGYLDEDGYLYFVSRRKRIIKKKGMNIFPLAIEKKISLLDGVIECAYLSRNEGKNEVTYLFVAMKEGLQEDENYIKEALKEGFYEYEMPDHIIFKKHLPKTNVSKIDYQALLESLN